MSGNGDPLASAIMRPLIHEFQPRSTQTFRLFTNGLLLKKQLEKSRIVPNITQYFISIDAGSADVYHHVRQPGRWSVLIDNLNYLQAVAKTHRAEVLLKFVLQRDNWHDMENFVNLCVSYGFHGVINRLEDWGTWPQFRDHDVIGNQDHVLHDQAVTELGRVYRLYGDRVQFNSSLKDLATK
jgi:MoaA/NifB/PqqE/SkfB family radical SAM enzyme